MPLLIVTSDRFAWHQTPPGHPERPERAGAMHVVAERWRGRGAHVSDPGPATREQLLRVHTAGHVDAMAATAGRAVRLDPDTFTSPESWELAQLAAGAAVTAVDAVLEGRATRAAALVRPPGHHAEPDRAMGFCLINNIAVAAAHARARGVERVAIVDIDVHHGNGTQAAFVSDPAVLFISTHQWPFYPGSGHEAEVGTGAGSGFTVNIPLDGGATDLDYDLVCRQLIVPILADFKPGLLLVSAGFDAHEQDPLGGMRMTAGGYRGLAQQLVTAADRYASGRMAIVTEGGYHLPALMESLDATLGAMAGDAGAAVSAAIPDGGDDKPRRGMLAVKRVRAAQFAYWRGL